MSACPACKFENPKGRRFCQRCGSALPFEPPPPPPPSPPDSDGSVTLSAELKQSREQLEQARQEERRLAQLLEDRENELKSARDQIAHVAAESSAPSKDHVILEEKFKGALAVVENEKAKLGEELTAIRKQLQESLQRVPGGTSKRKSLAFAVGGLILASATGLGGFRYGQVDPDKTHRDKLQVLETQLAAEQGKSQDLQSQLNQSRQNVDQLTTQVSSRVKEAQDASQKLSSVKHDLGVTQASLIEKTTSERQLRQEEQSIRQSMAQLKQDASMSEARYQALQQIVQKHPAWNNALSYNGPKSGEITWEADRSSDKSKDKSFDVVFDRGQVTNDRKLPTKSLSGSLPGEVPVIVRSLDKGVCISTPPDIDSHWSRMTVHIEGKNTRAHLRWTVPGV
jgi:hypothetical protein